MYLLTPKTPALILAPMEGITDAPMRRYLTTFQPWTFCVSEFIRVSHSVPPDHVLLKYVPELLNDSKTASGTPVIPQILGGDPERLALTAQKLIALGAPGIDLNFGCPAKTVNRHDGGATLLQFPERIFEIVSAVRSAVPRERSVSAKLRLGWDDPGAIFVNALQAAKAGASWITIHGRTKMQGYTPPAYWEPIGRVRRELDIPVVANGEIWSLADFYKCREQTGADHYMVGRGALADPWLPAQIHRELFESKEVLSLDIPWRDLISGFAQTSDQVSERQITARIKQWLSLASKHGKFQDFDSVKRAGSVNEITSRLWEGFSRV